MGRRPRPPEEVTVRLQQATARVSGRGRPRDFGEPVREEEQVGRLEAVGKDGARSLPYGGRRDVVAVPLFRRLREPELIEGESRFLPEDLSQHLERCRGERGRYLAGRSEKLSGAAVPVGGARVACEEAESRRHGPARRGAEKLRPDRPRGGAVF